MKRKHRLITAILIVFALLISSCGSAPAKPEESSSSGKETAQTSEKSTSETEKSASATSEATSEAKSEAASEAVSEASSASSEAEAASEATSASSEAEATSASTSASSEAEPAGEPGGAAYAWLGLQDMPKCKYLDALATYHYIREFTSLSMGYVSECVEAVDGVNTFSTTGTMKSYRVDGKVLSVNDASKNYSEFDMTDMVDLTRQNLEMFKESGENMVGRAFVGTGKEPIPAYAEQYNDPEEYEYYEYNRPESEEIGMPMTEKFYMKDGDVIAVYMNTFNSEGESIASSTEVIKSISEDIPEGTFDFPDLTGYEKIEL